MPPVITNLTPTTELEAVNAMLSAIGEAPIADLTSPQRDVEMALNVLRMTTREVQSRGWRFNREYNYALPNADGYGNPLRYIFVPPAGAISFTLSRTPGQVGMDFIVRKNRVAYTNVTVGQITIIADRLNGSDTWAVNPLHLDVIWYVDFESMPDVARRHVTSLASLRFCTNQSGPQETLQSLQADAQSTLALLQNEQDETTQFATQDPSTEVGALNSVLVANGKPPVASLALLTTPESVGALDVLRTITRAMLLEGYTFNTERGVILQPVGQVNGLNVFKAPVGALKVEITPTYEQLNLELGLRPSKVYQEAGQPVLVFYDRINNVDGIPASTLLVDVTWSIAYADLPETAKQYVTVKAARLWAKNNGNKNVLLTQNEEDAAFRQLKRDQGNDDVPNMFDNTDTLGFMGYRPRTYGVQVWRPTGRR